ncbi:glycosyltransferase [Litoribrevibacter albus]|uniref:glycosyltransferase n=1 Tax=Litoribrevibacter albus TaxID=1473156 RepID=UPI0024E08CB1|nr:glycosyltransferase [Litoribrevibacter albus]
MKVLAFPAYKNEKSNPYNALLYRAVVDKDLDVIEFSLKKLFLFRYNVVHIHWPEFYLNSNYYLKALVCSSLLLLGLFIAKLFNKKVVWTVHNLVPHHIKYKKTNSIFWLLFLKLIDGVVSLSKSNEKILFSAYPELKGVESSVVYHGLYDGCYPSGILKNDALKKLGLKEGDRVVLFLGQVKKYKNVEALISVFNSNCTLKNDYLVIAGKFESQAYFEEIKAQAKSENILIFDGFVDTQDMQVYFSAADVSVLPFNNIFNSGSALLSVTFKTPVLIPYTENFEEYSRIINGMIYTYSGNISNELIADVLDGNRNSDSLNLDSLSWSNIAKSLKSFYSKIVL